MEIYDLGSTLKGSKLLEPCLQIANQLWRGCESFFCVQNRAYCSQQPVRYELEMEVGREIMKISRDLKADSNQRYFERASGNEGQKTRKMLETLAIPRQKDLHQSKAWT